MMLAAVLEAKWGPKKEYNLSEFENNTNWRKNCSNRKKYE